MQLHTELIKRFYGALSQRDWAGMVGCYHPTVHFTDPVFDLHGVAAGQMWRMLCTNGRDLSVEFNRVVADEFEGSAHWEARYTFSATGKSVHNVIDARFEFRNGLIVRHVDQFDFPRWARQALGAPGWLLGHTAFLHHKVQLRAAKSLEAFVLKNP